MACVLVPRFSLLTALEEEHATASGRRLFLAERLALAPEPGRAAVVGEVSARAEAVGVRAGMQVGEALARCPGLRLIPPDPERAERTWERALCRLERIGAEVESPRWGECFFEIGGLEGLWGAAPAILRRARRAIGMPGRLAAAPTRFAARAAAAGARPGRSAVISEDALRRFLDPLPVSTLADRAGKDLVDELERLGITRLGRLASLPADLIADRFGEPGLLALRLATGHDIPLRPRHGHEPLVAELELPEAIAGIQLDRALELLCDRLLADRSRRGRTVRGLRLSARLAGGGGWHRRVTLRRPSADSVRLRLALDGSLTELRSPASLLRLEATELGPGGGEQLSLSAPDEERRSRIGEAVRQARAAAGSEAVLRVLDVDPESRLPERRAVLTPFPSG